MTDDEWNELLQLSGNHNTTIKEGQRFEELLDKTVGESDHKEGYEGACLCQECCSYG